MSEPATDVPPSSVRPARPRWGAARRALSALALLLGLPVLLVAFLVASLNARWLKQRVERSARAATGLSIHYGRLHLGLASLELEDLVVESPEPLRLVAPTLAHVARVAVGFQVADVLRKKPSLDSLDLDGVTVAVVVDDDGKTSFDALPPRPPSPTVPLSQELATLLSAPLPVRTVRLRSVGLELVRTHREGPPERTTLTGLDLSLANAARATSLALSLGTKSEPFHLTVRREHAGVVDTVVATLFAGLELRPDGAAATVDLRDVKQDLAPRVDPDHWLSVALSVACDAHAKKTVIALRETSAGDGVLHADGSVEVPDDGPPVVRALTVDLDAAKLLRWLPPGWVPVELDAGHVRATAADYSVSDVTTATSGTFVVDGELAGVKASAVGGTVDVEHVTVHADAAPKADVVGTSVKLHATGVVARLPFVAGELAKVDLDGAARVGRRGSVDGHATLAVSEAQLWGGRPVVLKGLRADVIAKGVSRGEGALPLEGDVSLAVALASAHARAGARDATLEGVKARGHTTLRGAYPVAFDLSLPVDRVKLSTDGETVVDTNAQVELSLRDVTPSPRQARGEISVHVGDGEARVEGRVRGGHADYSLEARSASLRLLRPWLPAGVLRDLPVDRVGAEVSSKGTVDGLLGGALAVDHRTTVELAHVGYRTVQASSLTMTVASKGGLMTHEGTVDVSARGLSLLGEPRSDEHLAATLGFDRAARSVKIEAALDGRASVKAQLDARYDGGSQTVVYSVGGKADKLAGLAPLLAATLPRTGVDLSALSLSFSSQGSVVGLVTDVTTRGAIELARDPTRTAWIEGQTSLSLFGLSWASDTASLVVPSAEWHAKLSLASGRRTLASDLEVPSLHATLGKERVDLTGVDDRATVALTGDLRDPDASLDHRASIAKATDDVLLGYPIAGLVLSTKGEREHDGVIHLSEVVLTNPQAGTRAELSGNIELGASRRRLALTGAVTQKLDRISVRQDLFTGTGDVALDATVTSTDFSLLHLRAGVKASDVSFALPAAHVRVASANGDVPIALDVVVGKNGVDFRGGSSQSAYSMLRFADQHPLLTRSGFISVGRVETHFLTVAPLAGNLSIDRGVVSLRQFEAGVRGGTVTGQCAVDWRGARSTAELHVRATGVRSSHGEPFDGNIAVLFAAADRSLEGRADIVRIGPRHFVDLMDVVDPARTDPGIARIRSALSLGYPDRVRLLFDHGFASAKVELGGIARFITISEIRGIPMGPILSNVLENALPNGKEEP